MAAAGRLRYWYLAHLLRPAYERELYRLLEAEKFTHLLEIGAGDCSRALRMFEVLERWHPADAIHYTGIDLFEARGDRTGIPLKQAYRTLRAEGVKAQLIPGDCGTALARTANSMPGQQLIVIAHGHTPEALEQAWFYLPRVATPTSHILLEEPQGNDFHFRTISRMELQKLARRRRIRTAA